jgi:hypothetical protein
MTATPVSLTRDEFNDRFPVVRLLGDDGPNEELRWYSHNGLAGIVTRDRVDADFGWLVLKRGENPDFPDQFTPVDFACSLTSQQEAESALFLALWNSR